MTTITQDFPIVTRPVSRTAEWHAHVPKTFSIARLWAMARGAGRPTADPAGLDGDVLVAAQAREEDASIVTTNPRHFESLADARRMDEVDA